MRKFEEETKLIIDDMIINYDIEKDYFYKQGLEKGLSVEDASFLSGLSIEEVKEEYQKLEK